MHRTEGDGYVVEGGKNRFIDQSLPTYAGTVDTAEYNNAVQEEICNLIELLGGTVASSAATDRANGWQQLYDILLDSEKITDAALHDFDLGKGWGILDVIDGHYEAYVMASEIGVSNDTSGSEMYALLSGNVSNPGLRVYDQATSCMTRIYKGIRFSGGPGEIAFDSIQFRRAGYAMTATPYVNPSTGTVSCNPNHTLDLADTVVIYSATVRYSTVDGDVVTPARLQLVSVSSVWKVVGVMWFQRTDSTTDPLPTSNEFDCIVEYDAATL